MTLAKASTHNPPVPQSAIVSGADGARYRFTVLSDGLLRYEWAPDGVFEDRPSAFAAQRSKMPLVQYELRESQETLEIITSRFHMTYNRQEFNPHGFFVLVFGHTRSLWRFSQEHETLGGTYRTLDNVDGRVEIQPGVAAKKGFANIDDSHTMLFNEDGSVAPRRSPELGRIDAYLFCYGHDYREAVKTLYRVSGPQPLLPRWTLGNWWSRYYEYSAASYLELMDTFGENRIPLSVAVLDMDWHLTETDRRVVEANQTGWTGYTWNRKLFPDPKEFVKSLHDRKLKTTLNEHPADGVASYEDIYETMAEALKFDTSKKESVPFDITNRGFLKAYFDILMKSLEDDGLDFWWIDWQQGEHSLGGIDPLWMLNHYHFLHNEKLQAGRDPKNGGGSRPIVFSRYAGPGSHRYPIGFSGDTVTSWDSLAFQPEFTATASNIGYGWWSHDIGGHMLGVRDDELMARWVQLGVLSPIMRLHSTKNRWVCKEPWKLPSGPRHVVTDFLRLRHRLLPYLHTMNVRAAEEGEPIVQPMYWDYAEREEAYNVPNQYFFGTEMMVAPITSPQNHAVKTGKVKAWLPPGTYVDFFTGVVYNGNRLTWLSRTLDKLPVLLKQGAIVPLDQNPEPENGGHNPSAFEVAVVVGADGQFEILEEEQEAGQLDAGKSPQNSTHWVKTPIVLDQNKGTITVGPANGSTSSTSRGWTIRLLGVKAVDSLKVTIDGTVTEPNVKKADSGLLISLGDVSSDTVATLALGTNPQLAINDPLALADPILFDAEIGYQLKEKIDDILSPRGVANSIRATQIDATDMDPDLRLLLLEFLFADSRS